MIINKFLSEYIDAMIEANDIELTNNQKENIIEQAERDEELWDFVDSKLWNMIESEVK